MAEQLQRDDITQLFVGTLCLYKGTPVYVIAVSPALMIQYLELTSQKKYTVLFNLDHFTSPAGRLGMVNCFNGAVWASRMPIRRYSVGLSNENFRTHEVRGLSYPAGRGVSAQRVMTRSCPELADTMFGIYPTFADAYSMAKENHGSVAFDRQFAVNCDGIVVYKTKAVAQVKNTDTVLTEKHFMNDYAYLSLLLEGAYEKGSGIYRLSRG